MLARRMTPTTRLMAVTVICLSAIACSSPDRTSAAKSDPAGQANLPEPSYQVDGRKVRVRLPYLRQSNMVWVSGEKYDELGPFTFETIDIEPGRGSNDTAIDVSVYSYTASGPGTGTLRFGLVPAGKTLIGPPETLHQGPPAALYEQRITVQ